MTLTLGCARVSTGSGSMLETLAATLEVQPAPYSATQQQHAQQSWPNLIVAPVIESDHDVTMAMTFICKGRWMLFGTLAQDDARMITCRH